MADGLGEKLSGGAVKRGPGPIVAGFWGGLAGGAICGGVDAAQVLYGTGSTWLALGPLLEPTWVYALAGALGGAVLGILYAVLRKVRDPWAVFRLIATVVAGIGALGVMVSHQLDVAPWRMSAAVATSYAILGLKALAIALLVWWVAGNLGRRLAPVAIAVTSAVTWGLVAVGLVIVWSTSGGSPAAGERPEPSSEAPDVVLIVLDTTRADGLSVYGNPRPTSPHLDALAREGMVFTRAYAPGTWTSPSHASLFTGVYPSTHGTFGHHTTLDFEAPTLAEVLQEAGYQTFFVSNNSILTRRHGWTRGFDHAVTVNLEDISEPVYRRIVSQRTRSSTPLKIDFTIRALQQAGRTTAPAFLFLNLADPHTFYMARAPYYRQYTRELDLDGVDLGRVQRIARENRVEADWEISAGEMEALRARYDSEVAWMDAELGRLFDYLRSRRSERPLVIAVTSDHGEMLGEHKRLAHGLYPYEELIHIPMILWGGPFAGQGASDELASLVDLFPTLAAAAGVDVARQPQLQGRRLLLDPAPDTVFAEQWATQAPRQSDEAIAVRKAAIASHSKLVRVTAGDHLEFDLYDLSQDPDEQDDLFDLRSDESLRLGASLDRQFSMEEEAVENFQIDDEQRLFLESLGYLGDEPTESDAAGSEPTESAPPR